MFLLTNPKNYDTGHDKFTYDFHLADHSGLAVIDKGETDYENFIKEFRIFPGLIN
jgi:hypothetical protein